MVLAICLIFVFVVGASVGSFLNVAISRLPLEKSLVWPSSRCGACHQSIRWYDNVPLLSYLWLRGRCRNCGQSYSVGYLLVELGTALAFVALFLLEMVADVHGWGSRTPFPFRLANAPLWIGFGWHALLLSFLIVASVCDLKSREIPLQLTLTGTLIGLIGAALMPWPWPRAIPAAPLAFSWQDPEVPLLQGIYAWPFWGPLPAWAGEGEWPTGLATGVCGALLGTFLCRTIGFVCSKGLGKDALGLGDADLMMMAGAFLGWQIVLVGFFLSVVPALFFGIIQMTVRRDSSLPFGPSLSLGVMATCLAWEPIGTRLRTAFFWGAVMMWGAVLAVGLMFLMSLLMRLMRGKEEPES